MSSHDQPTNPSPSTLTNPQDDADRIRLKRLAKLQTSRSGSPGPSPSPQPAASLPPVQKPKPIPPPSRKQSTDPPPIFQPRPQRQATAPPKLDFKAWEYETIQQVLRVTLRREEAASSKGELVWLKDLSDEMSSEDSTLRLSNEIIDRLIIARLEFNPEDPVHLASSAAGQSSFEYLSGCWKRLQSARTALLRRGFLSDDTAMATPVLAKLKDLLISYTGLSLQEPSMFYQPPGKVVGSKELLPPLLGLASASPLTSLSYTSTPSEALEPSDMEQFITDLAARFDGDGLDDILEGVFMDLVELLTLDRQGLAGAGTETGWRAALAAMEGLVSVKPVAAMMTRLPQWIPEGASASSIEKVSVLGPAARLSVFGREFPQIAEFYFSGPEKRTRSDVESSNTNLRATLHNLQQSLFTLVNSAVRSGPVPREATLNYFARVLNLNLKRGAMRVDPNVVASDGFMINLQSVLLRLAEPFLDAKYTKIDKVDPRYLAYSSRLHMSEETRINATSEQVQAFQQELLRFGNNPPSNFISEIFFLTAAFNHYALVRTLTSYRDLEKSLQDIEDYLERLEADRSYIGTPMESQVTAAMNNVKKEKAKRLTHVFAYQVQLLDSDLIFRMIGFTTFVMAWLIRLVDPLKQHPEVPVALPLPPEPPMEFTILPEYFIEDIVEFYLFLVRYSPGSMELSGKKEIVEFTVTFLTSTQYIKNPYLRAKLVQILFYGTLSNEHGRMGVLGPVLSSHPVALKYLMPAMMSFYVEVEHTGVSSQFYDKFEARRNLSYIMKTIWNVPEHRAALNAEVQNNMDNFVRFANLLMNDCTYLLDESLGKLTEIHAFQEEMASSEWEAKTPDEKRDRTRALQHVETQATSYIALGKSTVALLKDFTAETKEPFMAPEIVDRLAAMLDYNLDALVGPKCSNLKVKNMDKYRFRPRELLSDILSIYLNLSDRQEFVRAVAGEGRSYRKSLFEQAASIATKRMLKSSTEVEQLLLFVTKVEETKLLIESEEDLGDVPDEFLDPLMYTLMRDPVKLPSSKATVDRSTIKAHLLSDGTDPFNRRPLTIDDVVPDYELKAKIDAWFAEQRKKGMVLDAPQVSADTSMDVDD